jgi:hypothetical protein
LTAAFLSSIGFALIDAFNVKVALGCQRRNIRFNRVENSLAVIPLLERRHKFFALDLSY